VRDAPRRRRSEDDPGGGGLPLFPLILVVVFAGLLLGGALAHFFGGRSKTIARAVPQSASSVQLPTSPAIATLAPTVRPSETFSPKPTPLAPSTAARPAATPKVVAKTTSKPLPAASARRVVYVTPAPLPPQPATESTAAAMVAAAATPAANYVASGSDQAAQIVRAYLGSLARGDRATATTYLARGLPGEGFMDASSRILSLRPESAGGQQYKVTADVQTSTGEYYITFMLHPGPGGLQITDHDSIQVGH
jgi:hypothetical protein